MLCRRFLVFASCCTCYLTLVPGTFAQDEFSPTTLVNTTGIGDTQDDLLPAIATDRMGTWLVAWTNRTSAFDSDIFVARSTDAGATWSAPVSVNPNADTDADQDEQPELVFNDDGVWIITWVSTETLPQPFNPELNVFTSRSTDNGTTWSPPVIVSNDGDTGAFDAGRPALATDGDFLVLVWTPAYLDGGDEIRRMKVSVSTNNGASWSDPTFVDTTGQGRMTSLTNPSVAANGRGDWMIAYTSPDNLLGNDGGDRDVYYYTSTDPDSDWEGPFLLNAYGTSDSEEDPFVRIRGARQYWLAIWEAGLDTQTPPNTVNVLTSRQSRFSNVWSTPAVLTTIPTSSSLFFPELVEVGPDTWAAVWSGLNPDTNDLDLFINFSEDGGFTWTDPVCLNADMEMDSLSDRLQRITTDGSGGIMVAWQSNDRTMLGSVEQDIFASSAVIDVPSSGGGGEGCVIATAALGTPMAHDIDVLRRFRDETLLQSAAGVMFVDLYYRLGPPVAMWLSSRENVKAAVRRLLLPVVDALETQER